MFKHEILEQLNIISKQFNMKSIISLLQDSIEIYCGELSTYSAQCKSTAGELFEYEKIFSPYDITLVSYRDTLDGETINGLPKSSKRSTLVYKTGGMLQFYNFLFADFKKEWLFFPVGFQLERGKLPGECSYIDGFNMLEKLSKSTVTEFIEEVSTTKVIFDVLSCKNVSLTPVDPPEKLNKKRIKKGKPPLYRYHVLTVDLDKGRKQSGVGRGANLGTMPVHLCRGHFKEYTDEKPLFGRVTGRFWWQPYARGKAENGVVMKDYEIKKSNV